MAEERLLKDSPTLRFSLHRENNEDVIEINIEAATAAQILEGQLTSHAVTPAPLKQAGILPQPARVSEVELRNLSSPIRSWQVGDVADVVARVLQQGAFTAVEDFEITSADLDLGGRALKQSNKGVVRLEMQTGAIVGVEPFESGTPQDILINPNAHAVTFDERAFFNPYGFSIPAGDDDHVYLVTSEGGRTTGYEYPSARTITSMLRLPITAFDNIASEGGGDYVFMWGEQLNEGGSRVHYSAGNREWTLQGGASIVATPPYGLSVGGGKYSARGAVGSGPLEFGLVMLEVALGDGIIYEESHSATTAKCRVSRAGANLTAVLTSDTGASVTLQVPYGLNAAGRCRFWLKYDGATLSLTCEGVTDSKPKPTGNLSFNRMFIGGYYVGTTFTTSGAAVGTVLALGYSDPSFEANTVRWFNVNRRLKSVAQDTDFATKAFVLTNAGGSATGDRVADLIASEDAVSGVLSIDASLGKNLYTILLDANASLKLINTAGVSALIDCVVKATGASRTLTLSQLRSDLAPTTIAAGAQRDVLLDINAFRLRGLKVTVSDEEQPYTVPGLVSVTLTPGSGQISVAYVKSSDPLAVVTQFRKDNISWDPAPASPWLVLGPNGTPITIEMRHGDGLGNFSSVMSRTATPVSTTKRMFYLCSTSAYASLAVGEQAFVDRYVAQGWTITLIKASASADNAGATDFSTADLIVLGGGFQNYVSNIPAWDTAKPIMLARTYGADPLRLCTNGLAYTTPTSIVIENASHAAQPSGRTNGQVVSILPANSDEISTWNSANIASGAVILSRLETTTRVTSAVWPVGAALTTGVAPAKRALCFMGSQPMRYMLDAGKAHVDALANWLVL